ncbi:MAG: OmpH family outer membrane protein [Treponema sp.]|nr:OmpH family outer membrane protein [Treponema sp.]
MNRIMRIFAIAAVVMSLCSIAMVVHYKANNVTYGFVNTEKLLNSFVESQKALDEIRAEEEKWTAERTIIEDSLRAFEERMKETYASLSVSEKKKMKEEQVNRIEELGRFNQARSVNIQNMRVEKLQSVYQKINAAMADFALSRGIDIVFASSNGSIVYGDGTKADLTEDFVLFLNMRFK